MNDNDLLTIQRTMIITCGQVSDLAGQAVLRLFEDQGAPAEIITLLQGCTELSAAEISAGLRQISQAATQPVLARQGWTLDRLDEVALYLLIDLDGDAPHQRAIELAGQVIDAAEQRFGLGVAGMLLILAPDLEDATAAANLAPLINERRRLFSRGVFGLGLVNQNGLCLAGEAELAERCAKILFLLAASPLRDAPEWLADLNGGLGGPEQGFSSIGLYDWYWTPHTIQERLANLWATSALAVWRRADEEQEPSLTEQQAHGWLDEAGFQPADLKHLVIRQLNPLREPPAWRFPLPWRLRKHYRRLQLVARLAMPSPQPGQNGSGEQGSGQDFAQRPSPDGRHSGEDQAAEILDGAVDEVQKALLAKAGQMLDERPVAGVSRALRFSQALSKALEGIDDDLAGRQEIHQARVAILATQGQALSERMDSALSRWPQPRIRSWLWVTMRPWCWPGLARRYWHIEKLGRSIVRHAAELQRWQREAHVTTAIAQAYVALRQQLAQIDLKVEEIDDMLSSLQREIGQETPGDAPEPEADESLVEVLYWHTVEGTDLEATRAARAVDGLGQQVGKLDDALLERLLSAGRERFAGVAEYTATDVLALLYPTPGALNGWWQQGWEGAAPLWRYDEAQVPEAIRAQAVALTLVYGSGAQQLSGLLALPVTPDLRWLSAGHQPAGRRRTSILRLQGEIPLQLPESIRETSLDMRARSESDDT